MRYPPQPEGLKRFPDRLFSSIKSTALFGNNPSFILNWDGRRMAVQVTIKMKIVNEAGKSQVLGLKVILFLKMISRCFAKMGEVKTTNNSICLLDDRER